MLLHIDIIKYDKVSGNVRIKWTATNIENRVKTDQDRKIKVLHTLTVYNDHANNWMEEEVDIDSGMVSGIEDMKIETKAKDNEDKEDKRNC